MTSSVREKLRTLLAGYASGVLTLQDFNAEFALMTWDAAVDDRGLVYDLELLMAEYAAGRLSESELRQSICDALGSARL